MKLLERPRLVHQGRPAEQPIQKHAGGGGGNNMREFVDRFSRMAQARLFTLTAVRDDDKITSPHTIEPHVRKWFRDKIEGQALLFDSSMARQLPPIRDVLCYCIGGLVENCIPVESVGQAISFSGQRQLYVYGGSDVLGDLFDRALVDRAFVIRTNVGEVPDCGTNKYPMTRLLRHYSVAQLKDCSAAGCTIEEYSLKAGTI